MSTIAVLAKAETLDEKIVPRTFINDEHLELHQSEMRKLFKMKCKYESRFNADRGAKKFVILDNVDWRLKLEVYYPGKSTIRELWTGESRLVEWRFFPDGEYVDDFDDIIIYPEEIFIVKNFMIISTFHDDHGSRELFLNLSSRKLFWMPDDELRTKIL